MEERLSESNRVEVFAVLDFQSFQFPVSFSQNRLKNAVLVFDHCLLLIADGIGGMRLQLLDGALESLHRIGIEFRYGVSDPDFLRALASFFLPFWMIPYTAWKLVISFISLIYVVCMSVCLFIKFQKPSCFLFLFKSSGSVELATLAVATDLRAY